MGLTAPGRDAGVTLVEVVVSMSLMSVVAAAFTAGIVQVHRVANTVQAQADAAQQLTVAFVRLDREVAYASAISVPGQVAGNWYVEYLIGAGGTPTCVELRLNIQAGQLQRRSWAKGSPSAPSPWLPLASDVTAATGAPPFSLVPPDAKVSYPRLQVAIAGRTGVAMLSQRVTTWAALNATDEGPTDDCASLRAVPS